MSLTGVDPANRPGPAGSTGTTSDADNTSTGNYEYNASEFEDAAPGVDELDGGGGVELDADFSSQGPGDGTDDEFEGAGGEHGDDDDDVRDDDVDDETQDDEVAGVDNGTHYGGDNDDESCSPQRGAATAITSDPADVGAKGPESQPHHHQHRQGVPPPHGHQFEHQFPPCLEEALRSRGIITKQQAVDRKGGPEGRRNDNPAADQAAAPAVAAGARLQRAAAGPAAAGPAAAGLAATGPATAGRAPVSAGAAWLTSPKNNTTRTTTFATAIFQHQGPDHGQGGQDRIIWRNWNVFSGDFQLMQPQDRQQGSGVDGDGSSAGTVTDVDTVTSGTDVDASDISHFAIAGRRMVAVIARRRSGRPIIAAPTPTAQASTEAAAASTGAPAGASDTSASAAAVAASATPRADGNAARADAAHFNDVDVEVCVGQLSGVQKHTTACVNGASTANNTAASSSTTLPGPASANAHFSTGTAATACSCPFGLVYDVIKTAFPAAGCDAGAGVNRAHTSQTRFWIQDPMLARVDGYYSYDDPVAAMKAPKRETSGQASSGQDVQPAERMVMGRLTVAAALRDVVIEEWPVPQAVAASPAAMPHAAAAALPEPAPFRVWRRRLTQATLAEPSSAVGSQPGNGTSDASQQRLPPDLQVCISTAQVRQLLLRCQRAAVGRVVLPRVQADGVSGRVTYLSARAVWDPINDTKKEPCVVTHQLLIQLPIPEADANANATADGSGGGARPRVGCAVDFVLRLSIPSDVDPAAADAAIAELAGERAWPLVAGPHRLSQHDARGDWAARIGICGLAEEPLDASGAIPGQGRGPRVNGLSWPQWHFGVHAETPNAATRTNPLHKAAWDEAAALHGTPLCADDVHPRHRASTTGYASIIHPLCKDTLTCDAMEFGGIMMPAPGATVDAKDSSGSSSGRGGAGASPLETSGSVTSGAVIRATLTVPGADAGLRITGLESDIPVFMPYNGIQVSGGVSGLEFYQIRTPPTASSPSINSAAQTDSASSSVFDGVEPPCDVLAVDRTVHSALLSLDAAASTEQRQLLCMQLGTTLFSDQVWQRGAYAGRSGLGIAAAPRFTARFPVLGDEREATAPDEDPAAPATSCAAGAQRDGQQRVKRPFSVTSSSSQRTMWTATTLLEQAMPLIALDGDCRSNQRVTATSIVAALLMPLNLAGVVFTRMQKLLVAAMEHRVPYYRTPNQVAFHNQGSYEAALHAAAAWGHPAIVDAIIRCAIKMTPTWLMNGGRYGATAVGAASPTVDQTLFQQSYMELLTLRRVRWQRGPDTSIFAVALAYGREAVLKVLTRWGYRSKQFHDPASSQMAIGDVVTAVEFWRNRASADELEKMSGGAATWPRGGARGSGLAHDKDGGVAPSLIDDLKLETTAAPSSSSIGNYTLIPVDERHRLVAAVETLQGVLPPAAASNLVGAAHLAAAAGGGRTQDWRSQGHGHGGGNGRRGGGNGHAFSQNPNTTSANRWHQGAGNNSAPRWHGPGQARGHVRDTHVRPPIAAQFHGYAHPPLPPPPPPRADGAAAATAAAGLPPSAVSDRWSHPHGGNPPYTGAPASTHASSGHPNRQHQADGRARQQQRQQQQQRGANRSQYQQHHQHHRPAAATHMAPGAPRAPPNRHNWRASGGGGVVAGDKQRHVLSPASPPPPPVPVPIPQQPASTAQGQQRQTNARFNPQSAPAASRGGINNSADRK